MTIANIAKPGWRRDRRLVLLPWGVIDAVARCADPAAPSEMLRFRFANAGGTACINDGLNMCNNVPILIP